MSAGPPKLFGLSLPWARRALALSLVVNFLFLGAVVGLSLRATEKEKRGFGRYVIGEITQIIGEDRREEAIRLISERSEKRRSFRTQRSEDWRAVADLIADPDYEADALRSLLHLQADGHDAGRRGTVEPFVAVVTLMTPEERAVFANKIRAYVEMRERRRK